MRLDGALTRSTPTDTVDRFCWNSMPRSIVTSASYSVPMRRRSSPFVMPVQGSIAAVGRAGDSHGLGRGFADEDVEDGGAENADGERHRHRERVPSHDEERRHDRGGRRVRDQEDLAPRLR